MIHTRTKIVAIVAFCFFAVMLLGYVSFFRIVMNHKATLATERLRAAEVEDQRESLSTLEGIVASSEASREKLRGYILEDEDIIEFLSLIEYTAREQGVALTTDTLTVEPINDLFEELRVTLKVEGSFDGVMRMLRLLEALPQQSSLSQIQLIRAEKEGESWQASFDLRVTKFKKI